MVKQADRQPEQQPPTGQALVDALAQLFQNHYSADELARLKTDRQGVAAALLNTLSGQVTQALTEQDEPPETPPAPEPSLADLKITDYQNRDVASAPDRLTGTAAENKAVFDRLVKEIVSPSFNALIELLASPAGAAQLGFAASGEAAEQGFSTENVAAALVELFLRAYSKPEIDAALAENEARYRAAYEALFQLLNRELGAPASLAGVHHAAGDIALLAGEGIAVTPDPPRHAVKITATGTSIPQLHAAEHEPEDVDPLTAEIAYRNEASGLQAETVQEALDETGLRTEALARDLTQGLAQTMTQAVAFRPFSELDDVQIRAGILTNAGANWNTFTFPPVNGVPTVFPGVPSVTVSLSGLANGTSTPGFVLLNNITPEGFQYRAVAVNGTTGISTAVQICWQAIYDGGINA